MGQTAKKRPDTWARRFQSEGETGRGKITTVLPTECWALLTIS